MRPWPRLLLLATVLPCIAMGQSNSALRDPKQAAAFKRAHPCPDGPDKGSTTRCAGMVVDHKWPLCAGGADAPSNMRWQTAAEAKQKDVLEKRICAQLRKWRDE